jgi:hypothetical protein
MGSRYITLLQQHDASRIDPTQLVQTEILGRKERNHPKIQVEIVAEGMGMLEA